MRRFSLHKRGNIFYAQLRNPNTGGFLPARSTRCTDRDEAVLVVNEWLHNGIPEPRTGRRRALSVLFNIDTMLETIRDEELTRDDARRIAEELHARGYLEDARLTGTGESAETLLAFLERFWNYDESPYVREKLAYGQSIGRRHCYESKNRLHHWRGYFGDDTRLCDVTRAQLKEFQLRLKDKGLAPKTVNAILAAGSVAFGWAVEQGTIATDPSAGLRKFAGASASRGILTPQQVKKLFAVEWPDHRARVASLTAMATGLRASEIAALRVEDVDKDRLHVRHSWSREDGLKTPKNGEIRTAPLPQWLRTELVSLAKQSPHDGGFVFYSESPNAPCSLNIFRRGLQRALVDMSLTKKDRGDEEKRKAAAKAWSDAGVTFHSWRHYYAAQMADRVDLRTLQMATGHKSPTMAAHYAAHASEEHFAGVAKAATDAFKIVPFKKSS